MNATTPLMSLPAVIPGLPKPLQVVPDDYARWLLWRAAVLEYRALITRQYLEDADFRAATDAAGAEDNALWLTLFGWIWEPRTRPGQPAGHVPFIPFAWQVRTLRWLDARIADLDVAPDGFISKSRGLGLSWIICAWAVHGFLYRTPWDGLLASRDQDYVDKAGNKKALFWKCDYILDHLPPPMLPDGFSTKRGTPTRSDMQMTNPVNGNALTGEAATANLGRGDRKTWAFVDEPVAFRDFGEAFDTLDGTTDHRLCGGTEKGLSEFRRMWTEAKVRNPDSVLELDWHLNPYNDQAWYDRTRKRFEEKGRLDAFRREYLREATAGMGELIYPEADRIQVGVFPYLPRGGQVMVWIDPGIRDATALHVLQFAAATGRYRLIDTYENAGQTSRFYASLLVNAPISGVEGYAYGPREYGFMDLMAAITDPILYIGDPYGRNRGGDGKKSFYEGLSEDARELSGGAHRINVVTSYQPEDTSYAGRRDALATMLPMIDFNDTPDVRMTRQALIEHRKKSLTEGRDIVNPTDEPVHGWGSHRVSALEFGAVHQRGGRKARTHAQPRYGPQHVTMGGKTRRGGHSLGNRGGFDTRTRNYAGYGAR